GRVEVLARPGELQVVAGHLRDPGLQVVLEEVEVRPRDRGRLTDAGACRRRRAADDDGVVRYRERLPALRQLALALVQQRLARGQRPGAELLLRVEEVPLRGLPLLQRRGL